MSKLQPDFSFVSLFSFSSSKSRNISISYIPASITTSPKRGECKRLRAENRRSFDRIEAKRSRRAFTFLGFDLHKQASVLFVRRQTTTRIASISLSRKIGDERMLFVSFFEKDRRKETRARARARVSYRSETARCHPLDTHLQLNAALRCDNGLECSRDRDPRRRRRRHSQSSVARSSIKRRRDATSALAATRSNQIHNSRRWSSSS